MEVFEKNIVPYDVMNADEAFMTGTPFCVLPVTSLNRIKIGDGKVGMITRKLLYTWSKNVGVDIVQQIKKWEKSSATVDSSSPSPYSFK